MVHWAVAHRLLGHMAEVEVLDLSSPGAERRSRKRALATGVARSNTIILSSGTSEEEQSDPQAESEGTASSSDAEDLAELEPLPALPGVGDPPWRRRRRRLDPGSGSQHGAAAGADGGGSGAGDGGGGSGAAAAAGRSLLQTCACGGSFREGWAWTHVCPDQAGGILERSQSRSDDGADDEGAAGWAASQSRSDDAVDEGAADRAASQSWSDDADGAEDSDDDVMIVGEIQATARRRTGGAAASASGGGVEVVGEAAATRSYRSRGLTRKHAFECPICMCDCEPVDAFTLSCTHSFCGGCIGQFVSGKVTEGQVALTQLICPDTGCKASLLANDIQAILTSHTDDGASLWSKFDEFRLRGVVEKEKAGRHCPGKGCGYMFFTHGAGDEAGARVREKFDCPRCSESFCLSCSTGWHGASESCVSAAARRRAEEGTDGDAELAAYVRSEGLKKCPSCALLVAKVDGCNALTCRCGIIFCWNCALQLHTAGLPEKMDGGQPYCTCDEWGVNAHRGKPVGAAMGGAAAGMPADVVRAPGAAAAAAAAAHQLRAAELVRLQVMQQQLQQQ